METKQVFRQRQLKPSTETGSFINMMMSSNSTLPQVGEGATILGWTDRHAYEVMSVSKDYRVVVIQQYQPERVDSLGMSDSQDYKYENLSGYNETVVWKWGAWRKVYKRLDKTEYSKVNIIFGVKDEYYDYSF